MDKFKVGQKIKYKSDHVENRPEQDVGLPNEYTVLAVENGGRKAFIYTAINERNIRGTQDDTGNFTWEVRLESAELIAEPVPPLVIEYEEPEEDEFTDNCQETCRPGLHTCKKSDEK